MGKGRTSGRVPAAIDGEVLALNAGLKRAVDGIQKIVAMRLHVKADQIRAQQAVEQFALPGADAEGFGIGPGNVPEDGDARVRAGAP